MIKLVSKPAKYGQERRTNRFAYFPRTVTREPDGARFRIWWRYYEVVETFYESMGWRDLYEYLIPYPGDEDVR